MFCTHINKRIQNQYGILSQVILLYIRKLVDNNEVNKFHYINRDINSYYYISHKIKSRFTCKENYS